MRRPTGKIVLFFLVFLAAGYGAALITMTLVLNVSPREFGFGWQTAIAIAVACILMILFDNYLELHLFEWPEEKPPEPPEPPEPSKPSAPPAEAAQSSPGASVQPPSAPPQPSDSQAAAFGFPYETQGDHWEVDFSDSSETYEGTELPMWILAGWAAFVIWAVAYLVSGLPDAF